MYPTNNKPKLFIRPHAHNEMMTICPPDCFYSFIGPFPAILSRRSPLSLQSNDNQTTRQFNSINIVANERFEINRKCFLIKHLRVCRQFLTFARQLEK